MWLHKVTKKPLSIKKLLQQGFDPLMVEPESLFLACPVTHGLSEKQLAWITDLEKLADEKDPYLVEITLKKLLDKVS